ncbi:MULTISPECIES: hypothetical protein [unclassified Salegentibacter]|uniref:hypothetical protein n=1 Tax=unclassified Salegentibacter TaxID=2633436 RepID=UPI0012E07E69|nr:MULTISPECIES: hypothetical protein [unclassified Salegentibacter]GGX00063.1 hypothetical protein GCM10008086_31420 [Salegentibacter mishustinae]
MILLRLFYCAYRSFETFRGKSLLVNPADTDRKGKEQYTTNDRMDTQLISRKLIDGRLDSITIRNIEREEL